MQLEIEQKFPLALPEEVWAQLAELGAQFGPPIRQVDTYFQHPSRDFRQTDEAFRIRQVGDDNYLTYKGPKLDSQTKTRRELELPIAPGVATAGQFAEMFAALGFQAGGVVAKVRRSAQYEFAGREIEIAWDEVEGLGNYLELEIVADEHDFDSARQAIHGLAAYLGLDHPERRSYLELLFTRQIT